LLLAEDVDGVVAYSAARWEEILHRDRLHVAHLLKRRVSPRGE
jgi:hypothetical protein